MVKSNFVLNTVKRYFYFTLDFTLKRVVSGKLIRFFYSLQFGLAFTVDQNRSLIDFDTVFFFIKIESAPVVCACF